MELQNSGWEPLLDKVHKSLSKSCTLAYFPLLYCFVFPTFIQVTFAFFVRIKSRCLPIPLITLLKIYSLSWDFLHKGRKQSYKGITRTYTEGVLTVLFTYILENFQFLVCNEEVHCQDAGFMLALTKAGMIMR